MICVDGNTENTCAPGIATGDDDNCNGLDEDCDGELNEHYMPTSTSCGQGVCASTGQMICTSGSLSDTCEEDPSTGDDSDCDGVDDDCDGTVDEHYASTSTSCGDGVCASTGQMICVDGNTENTCAPGDTTGEDDDCDGEDENCNGELNENYVPTATFCGMGECAGNEGTLSCVTGDEVNSCEPFENADDEVCNDLDDDCDGSTDEGYGDEVLGACSSCYDLNYGPELMCGGFYTGNTSGFENTLDEYSLRPTYPEDGAERIYTYSTSMGGVKVYVKAINVAPPADVDYFLLLEECNVASNIGWGNTRLVFEPVADGQYLIAIDEYETSGEALMYDVQVDCDELDCEDDFDNDLDGLTDCYDDDCVCPE